MDRMQKKWRRSPESRGRSVRRNLSADCAWYASSPAIRLPSRVETIDATSPNVASWCAQLCERAEAAGVEVAYFLMVPSFEPGGARLAAAATPRVQLMVDACKTLRPEVSAAIGRGFSVAEPTLWRPDILSAGMPPALRRARQAWIAWAAEACGVCLYHGLDVPVFGPGGWRGLFKISAPFERMTPKFMRAAQEVGEHLHRAYVRIITCPSSHQLTEIEADALQLIAGGHCCKQADKIGATPKAAEKALERARDKLKADNTTQAALRAYQLGLIA